MLHWWSLTFSWTAFTCWVRLLLEEALKGHSSQRYSFFPSCMFSIWILRLPLYFVECLHWGHLDKLGSFSDMFKFISLISDTFFRQQLVYLQISHFSEDVGKSWRASSQTFYRCVEFDLGNGISETVTPSPPLQLDCGRMLQIIQNKYKYSAHHILAWTQVHFVHD